MDLFRMNRIDHYRKIRNKTKRRTLYKTNLVPEYRCEVMTELEVVYLGLFDSIRWISAEQR